MAFADRVLLYCLVAILAFSCSHFRRGPATDNQPPPPPPAGTSNDVADSAKDTGKAVVSLKESASTIQGHARDIDNKASDIQKLSPTMAPEVKDIKASASAVTAEAAKVVKVGEDLDQVKVALQGTKSKAEQLEQAVATRDTIIEAKSREITELRAANTKLEEAKKSALTGKLIYATMAGIFIIAIAGMMLVNGSRGAVGVAAGGATLSLASITISFFLDNWIYVCIIGGVAGLAALAYKAYDKHRDSKIAMDLVKSTEHLKAHLPEKAKAQLFGDLITDGEVGVLQSEATKAKVLELRKELATVVAPTIPKT